MLRLTDFSQQKHRIDIIPEKMIAVCFLLFVKQSEIPVTLFRLSITNTADSFFISLDQFKRLYKMGHQIAGRIV